NGNVPNNSQIKFNWGDNAYLKTVEQAFSFLKKTYPEFKSGNHYASVSYEWYAQIPEKLSAHVTVDGRYREFPIPVEGELLQVFGAELSKPEVTKKVEDIRQEQENRILNQAIERVTAMT